MVKKKEPELEHVIADALTNPEVAGPEVWYHNWMYSFLPSNDEFFLLGYCKNCRNSVAAKVNHSRYDEVVITKTEIPREGCSGPP